MRHWLVLFSMIFLIALAPAVAAGDLRLLVNDQHGQPLEDVVASLTPVDGKMPALAAGTQAVMDQRGLQFVPHVLPIRAGTRVALPNSDQVRHHVYSFSPAKPFELRLYKDIPGDPGVFPIPGIVTLGCNIHDWMLGYIVVLDTPYFAKSAVDGRLQLSGIPAGDYRLQLWHSRLIPSSDDGEVVALGSAAADRTLTLNVSPPEPPPAPPSELEQKFRRHQKPVDAR